MENKKKNLENKTQDIKISNNVESISNVRHISMYKENSIICNTDSLLYGYIHAVASKQNIPEHRFENIYKALAYDVFKNVEDLSVNDKAILADVIWHLKDFNDSISNFNDYLSKVVYKVIKDRNTLK